jgi:hypothetical protein
VKYIVAIMILNCACIFELNMGIADKTCKMVFLI